MLQNKYLLLIFAFAAACTPFQSQTPLPVKQVIDIAITPALRPITNAVQMCALQQEEVSLNIIETPANFLLDSGAGLYLRLGEPETQAAFAAPLAWEQVVVIVHPSNASQQIDVERIKSFYTDISSIKDVPEVTVLVPLKGDETRTLFDREILSNAIITPFAQLAPDPHYILELVSSDSSAVGYIPKAWLNESVHAIELDLYLPILVLSEDEPNAQEIKLVSCLQGEVGQAFILGLYQKWVDDPSLR